MSKPFNELKKHTGHEFGTSTSYNGSEKTTHLRCFDCGIVFNNLPHYDETKVTPHTGHSIVCVTYGGQNTAVECEDCQQVLYDIEPDDERDKENDNEDDNDPYDAGKPAGVYQ